MDQGQSDEMIDSYIARDHSLAGFDRSNFTPDVYKYEAPSSGHIVGGFSVADCPDEGLLSWSTVAASFFDNGYHTATGSGWRPSSSAAQVHLGIGSVLRWLSVHSTLLTEGIRAMQQSFEKHSSR
ncbi:hypothetical protein EX895_003622 [Sporisorium graminicola]|uniref:Uncharacterized protein n=1 Tax=Sporisorium graminicola TaxID=280036 RepID=A0A4U7KW08_9BASI|nr:hypothetical protein EX895_003622 [Sporisorium graminicola]TKY87608.1 hypothetical protein EX895_003622 [Sporisorium graminicola]